MWYNRFYCCSNDCSLGIIWHHAMIIVDQGEQMPSLCHKKKKKEKKERKDDKRFERLDFIMGGCACIISRPFFSSVPPGCVRRESQLAKLFFDLRWRWSLCHFHLLWLHNWLHLCIKSFPTSWHGPPKRLKIKILFDFMSSGHLKMCDNKIELFQFAV